jgi:hypothetical protein
MIDDTIARDYSFQEDRTKHLHRHGVYGIETGSGVKRNRIHSGGVCMYIFCGLVKGFLSEDY